MPGTLWATILTAPWPGGLTAAESISCVPLPSFALWLLFGFATAVFAAVSVRGAVERRDGEVSKTDPERFPADGGADSSPAVVVPRCRTDSLPASGKPQPPSVRQHIRGGSVFPRREVGAARRASP